MRGAVLGPGGRGGWGGARTDAGGQWHMLGLLTFLDPPRPDTRATLETALHYGVQTRMVRH